MKRWLAALMLIGLTGCATAPEPERLQLIPTTFSELSGWQEDQKRPALAAFLRSCESFSRLASQQPVGEGLLAAPAETWQALCSPANTAYAAGNEISAEEFFTSHFVPFRAGSNAGKEALLTGYFEPLLYGSRVQEGRYRFPLYRLPPDIADGVPYYTRQEIDSGALTGKNLEWLWVDDDIALFFLHIQGSGQVVLSDGSVIRAGYAGKNQQPYVAIGKVLAERGALKREEISMLSIQHWLWNHPHDAQEILWQNPSYVFFREITGEGPIGSQNVPLTAGRSLAVDRRFLPLGIPVFTETALPSPPKMTPEPYRHLLIAQDTGGAIRGALRGDIFFGSGNEAGMLAGFMKQAGQLTLLVPRSIAARLATP